MLFVILALLVVGVALLLYRIVTGTPISLLLRRNVGPSLCRLLGHQRDSGSVRKMDGAYRARCRRCDHRLVKANREDAWKADGAPLPIVKTIDRTRKTIRVSGVDHAHTHDQGKERSA